MEYVAVQLHRGTTLSAGAARTLVSYARRRRGRPCWEEMAVDLFSGADGESLLLARPPIRVAVLADYALPALQRLLRRR